MFELETEKTIYCNLGEIRDFLLLPEKEGRIAIFDNNNNVKILRRTSTGNYCLLGQAEASKLIDKYGLRERQIPSYQNDR